MILRRITEHVKAQNWFAVAIDFVIVVVGVFLGIQVQAWSVDRQNDRTEREYLSQLHAELVEMIDKNRSDVESISGVHARLGELRRHFAADAAGPDLTGAHCVAVVRSHIYAGEIVVPPTIEELVSTGRVLLVSNKELRTKIIGLAQSVNGLLQLNRDIQIDRLALSRRHPGLIRLGIVDRENSTCDFRAMRQSPEFLNNFVDNANRYEAYSTEVMSGQQDLRAGLHAALDRELNIVHAEKK